MIYVYENVCLYVRERVTIPNLDTRACLEYSLNYRLQSPSWIPIDSSSTHVKDYQIVMGGTTTVTLSLQTDKPSQSWMREIENEDETDTFYTDKGEPEGSAKIQRTLEGSSTRLRSQYKVYVGRLGTRLIWEKEICNGLEPVKKYCYVLV